MGPKIFLIFVVIFTLQYESLQAARRVDVRKRYAEGMERFSSWRKRRDAGEDTAQPSTDELLGLETGESLEEGATVPTAAGTAKEKLTETYEGLPVFGQSVVIEVDNGEPTGAISGHLIEGIHDDIPDTDPALSEEEALALAAEHAGDNLEDISGGSIQITLEIYVEDQDSTTEVMTFLAYSISYTIIRDGEPARPCFIIDANTGAIIRTWDGLTSRLKHRRSPYVEGSGNYAFEAVGGNIKMGRNTYGDRLPALQIYMEEGMCYLENQKIKVIDARQGGFETFSFPCEQGFNDSVNGAYSPLADGFFYGTMTYDLFMEWLGVEPLSFKIELVIHEGYSMENAFWDGQRTYFGDGMTTFYPLVILDVVAHEVAHGFTEQNSGLIYNYQSGGMNEAFSDIAGAAAEEYMKSVGEWQIGEDAFKAENQALRYMINPADDGVSAGDMQQYCPDMDVHYSSGLFNRAFYLLSNTEGWNVRMAFQAFAQANQLYWTPDSTFTAGACGVVQAAQDLGFNIDDVGNAFGGVGISSCGAGGQTSGLDLLNGIHAIQNESLTFVFQLEEENLEQLIFETYRSGYYYGSGQWILHIQTPERLLSTSPQDDTIVVFNPEPGTYVVTMEALESFENADLYVIKQEVILAEDIVYDGGVYNGSFYLPESVVAEGNPVAIRTGYPDSESTDYPKTFKISYESEVDIANGIGQISPCSRRNNKENMYEAFIRDPQPGQYNYQIQGSSYYYYYSPSDSESDMKMYMVSLMMPEILESR